MADIDRSGLSGKPWKNSKRSQFFNVESKITLRRSGETISGGKQIQGGSDIGRLHLEATHGF
jgi:hypothetical protein